MCIGFLEMGLLRFGPGCRDLRKTMMVLDLGFYEATKHYELLRLLYLNVTLLAK